MKRNELATLTPDPFPASSTNIFQAKYSQSRDRRAAHSLFVPLHYEKNYAYPLLVWLHGSGDNERQLKRVMPLVSLRNYVAIAPRGVCAGPDELVGGGANCWGQSEVDILEAQGRTTACIELAQQRANVHNQRIFIGGFADGGTMALRLALRMPQLFAGAFSLGGGLPQSHQPLINVDRARALPILLAHGAESGDFPTGRLCGDIRLLHSAGIGLAVRQYPCGDELTTQMLSDLDTWLMERVTGQTHEPNEVADPADWN